MSFQPTDIPRPVNEEISDANNTPWKAGPHWPYRRTVLDFPVRAARSGDFEGLALSPDGTTLIPFDHTHFILVRLASPLP